MKRQDQFLKEYFYRLSDDNLKVLHSRLSFRYSGDLPEVLNYVCNNKDVDRWLSTANSSNDLYNMIDSMSDFVNKEYQKRFEVSR